MIFFQFAIRARNCDIYFVRKDMTKVLPSVIDIESPVSTENLRSISSTGLPSYSLVHCMMKGSDMHLNSLCVVTVC
jgi:hypothetical protein